MNIEPHSREVAICGPRAVTCDQIEDLIKLLVTIRERFGNTAVRYSIQWGAAALWAEDEQKTKIVKLEGQLQRLKVKMKRLLP